MCCSDYSAGATHPYLLVCLICACHIADCLSLGLMILVGIESVIMFESTKVRLTDECQLPITKWPCQSRAPECHSDRLQSVLEGVDTLS